MSAHTPPQVACSSAIFKIMERCPDRHRRRHRRSNGRSLARSTHGRASSAGSRTPRSIFGSARSLICSGRWVRTPRPIQRRRYAPQCWGGRRATKSDGSRPTRWRSAASSASSWPRGNAQWAANTPFLALPTGGLQRFPGIFLRKMSSVRLPPVIANAAFATGPSCSYSPAWVCERVKLRLWRSPISTGEAVGLPSPENRNVPSGFRSPGRSARRS